MKYKQTIHFNGKDLTGMFRLPCVRCITKDSKDQPVLKVSSLYGGVICCHVGEYLVETPDGDWYAITKEEYNHECSVCRNTYP